MMRLLFTFILVLLFSNVQSYAQKKQLLQLTIEYPDKVESISAELDSSNIHNEVKFYTNKLWTEGYITAYVSEIGRAHKVQSYTIITGSKYYLAHLSIQNVDDNILRMVGFKSRLYDANVFSYRQINRLLEGIIDVSENNGYPFASAKLDSIQFSDSLVTLQLNYEPGPFISFDSIDIEGEGGVKQGFLMSYLDITPGAPYNEQVIENAKKKVSQLPYLQLNSEPYITFDDQKGTLHIDISKRKVNQVDGLLGVLPNQTDDDGMLINGYLNLAIYNLFSSGKQLKIEWQKTDNLSQNLDFSYQHPNLFHSPLGIGGTIELLKQDTAFLNRNISLTISTSSAGNTTYSGGIDFERSRLISTVEYEGDTVLPDVYNYDVNYYRLGFSKTELNNVVFPTQGWNINGNVKVGKKQIEKDDIFDDKAYEGLVLENTQVKLEQNLEFYFPVKRRFISKMGVHMGALISDQVFKNEMYRLGGLKTIRGFSELSLYTSSYVYTNLEARYLLEESSMIFAFVDLGYLKEKSTTTNDENIPASTGVGLELDTKNGIFTFIYTLGKSNTQPFGFSYSNIHFGYTGRF